MVPFVRHLSCRQVTPKQFAGAAIVTKHDHLVARVRMLNAEDALRLVFRLGQGGVDFTGVDRGGDKYLVACDDGSAGAFAFELDLPAQVA